MTSGRMAPSPFSANRSVKGVRLGVSSNGRHFIDQHGAPFFYLGDTAWSIFKQLRREDVDEYFANRAAKGFTVVQSYVLRGLKVQNAYGEVPLIGRDPTRLNEGFFRHVDFIIDRAEAHGIFMCLVIAFGEHIRRKTDTEERFEENESIFNPENAFAYARLLARRWREKPVIWNLGGDRAPVGDEAVFRAMAAGLKEGFASGHLVAFHGPGPGPSGGPRQTSSSWWFHDEPWLDFNTIQSGHGWMIPNYRDVSLDYRRVPAKPTIDMENTYEDFLVPRNLEADPLIRDGAKPQRRVDGHQVREAGYWAMLSGAAGHGYGCCGVWEFRGSHLAKDYSEPLDTWSGSVDWRRAMDLPGAVGMGIMRTLFEQRPWHRLVPDQSLILAGQGEEEAHIAAARASDGAFAIAYLPFGRRAAFDTSPLSGTDVDASWFDPRTGAWSRAGSFPRGTPVELEAPTSGPDQDWVLVLEDAATRVS
jgi:hypothetical protein